jgi:hypothetical protein
MFQHATRIQPLYFAYPNRHVDDVTIELPAEWAVESVPATRNVDLKRVIFRSAAQTSGQTLHLTRELELGLVYADVKVYDTIRSFYQTLRAGDQDRVVLSFDARRPKR